MRVAQTSQTETRKSATKSLGDSCQTLPLDRTSKNWIKMHSPVCKPPSAPAPSLKHKALLTVVLLGKEVIIVTEEYTTKGCSRCGLITDIGGSKTFTCQHCGFVAPRDAKSARDIFAKHIVSLSHMSCLLSLTVATVSIDVCTTTWTSRNRVSMAILVLRDLTGVTEL